MVKSVECKQSVTLSVKKYLGAIINKIYFGVLHTCTVDNIFRFNFLHRRGDLVAVQCSPRMREIGVRSLAVGTDLSLQNR